MWEQNLKHYDKLVEQCPKFDRKGKTMPYTSANGYMFSMINKAGEFGIRFSKETQEKYFKKYKTGHFKSHGAALKGYIHIPNEMFDNPKELVKLLNEAYEHVMSLDPK